MAHINELIDYVVNAFIVHDDKVLLIHHKALDRWIPVGGHIELDEDPDEALYREIKEETGLDQVQILSDKPDLDSPGTKFLLTPRYMDIHHISDTHQHVCFIYFATTDTAEVALEEEAHHAIRWFDRAELTDPAYGISAAVQFYANAALDTAKS